MIAVTILVVMMSLLFNIFSKGSDAWLKGQQQVRKQGAARQTMEWITRDLSQAFYSTSSPAIHFFGNSNAIYFISIIGTSVSSASNYISDLAEVAYVYNSSLGELYRYYTPPDPNSTKWNPRANGSSVPAEWSWLNVQNYYNYDYSSQGDSLIAQGVVDFHVVYADSTVSTNTWCTTNISGFYFPTGTNLPEVVDVYLTTVPPAIWRAPGTPNYTTLTNQNAKTYQTTVHIARRLPR